MTKQKKILPRLTQIAGVAALLMAGATVPAAADDWHWHSHDIHHFHEYDYDHWRHGYWFHGPHEGADGWWWIVDGTWYVYPSPVYPYPDPYTPPGMVTEVVPARPDAPAFVYYCRDPAGYYPYVPRCFAPWQRVAADVAAPPPAVVMAPTPVQVAPPPVVSMPPVASPPVAMPLTQNQRDIDDRQLNSLGGEFAGIEPNASHLRAKLKDLRDRVEAFRQTLFQHGYNAMDILHDTEDLEHRIDDRIAKLQPAKK